MPARRTHKPRKKPATDYMTIGGLKIPKIFEAGAVGGGVGEAAIKRLKGKKKKKKK